MDIEKLIDDYCTALYRAKHATKASASSAFSRFAAEASELAVKIREAGIDVEKLEPKKPREWTLEEERAEEHKRLKGDSSQT